MTSGKKPRLDCANEGADGDREAGRGRVLGYDVPGLGLWLGLEPGRATEAVPVPVPIQEEMVVLDVIASVVVEGEEEESDAVLAAVV